MPAPLQLPPRPDYEYRFCAQPSSLRHASRSTDRRIQRIARREIPDCGGAKGAQASCLPSLTGEKPSHSRLDKSPALLAHNSSEAVADDDIIRRAAMQSRHFRAGVPPLDLDKAAIVRPPRV